MICMVYFEPSIIELNVQVFRNKLMNEYTVGSKIFDNLYYTTTNDNEYKFIANINVKTKNIF